MKWLAITWSLAKNERKQQKRNSTPAMKRIISFESSMKNRYQQNGKIAIIISRSVSTFRGSWRCGYISLREQGRRLVLKMRVRAVDVMSVENRR